MSYSEPVFSDFKFVDAYIKINKSGESYVNDHCIGEAHEELETKNIVKKCQGITKKTRTMLTGNGTLKLKLHIKRSIYIAIYGLNNTGLKTGVYAYGTGNEYPELSLTAQISNEDGAKKYKGYPRLMANGGPKMDIVNGEEEVAEVEVEFNILPDEYGNGVYEALVDDLTDETLISTWLTAFSSDFVRQSTTTTTESNTPTV